MIYLVEKEGFKPSAALFLSCEQAEVDGKKFYPDTPFTVKEITIGEARERIREWERVYKTKWTRP